MSMRRTVIIIMNYFLVHKIEVENQILSAQILLKSNEISLA